MSLLLGVEEAEFNFLKESTGATAGNLSVQLNKLKDAGYISVKKKFRDNYPLTLCKITVKGAGAFGVYTKALKEYLNPKS